MTSILEVGDARRTFGGIHALAGVSLAVGAGEFVSIIGPNGAGKSTLINVLTGVIPPTAGSVRFMGRDIRGIGPVRLAHLGLARSFQLVHVFPELTVLETLQAAVVARRRRGGRLLGWLGFARLALDPKLFVLLVGEEPRQLDGH
jgi:branched-chain amino acid transport system ATP-binding protein